MENQASPAAPLHHSTTSRHHAITPSLEATDDAISLRSIAKRSYNRVNNISSSIFQAGSRQCCDHHH
ncbi:hypothetical protein DEO72_LG8g2535 [Vigna unguiculata]|uniref:Uncharacterized protein n=1 Tax=Vigna unguiculata TaxID=3917 RepID=A0A4D6MWJ9_VIGUN|nr:hypothetical protein DEO72_LG8g2535 [Vigna unguiculata]